MSRFDRGDRGGGRRDFARRDFGNRGDRQMFKTVCSNCGKECQVPFRPSGDKPVYCDECFKRKNRDSGSGRFEDGGQRRDNFGSTNTSQNQAQFDVINTKLNKILEILAPPPMPEIAETQIPKVQPKIVKSEPVKAESKKKTTEKTIKKASPKKKTATKK